MESELNLPRIKRNACSRLALLLLIGCVPAQPQTIETHFVGKSTSTKATIKGAAVGTPFAEGRAIILQSTGRRCEGAYDHSSKFEGYGALVCDDGRAGTFRFFTTGTSGGGIAVIADEEFTFEFVSR